MKNYISKLTLLLIFTLTLVSCDKDEPVYYLNPDASVDMSLSAQNLVLLKDNSENEILTISWSEPDFGYNAVAQYSILIDTEQGNFSESQTITAGETLNKTLTVAELNKLLLSLELEPEVANNVQFKVKANLSSEVAIESNTVTLNVTPYADKLDLSTTWGIVGSATPNGWDGPDVPFYKTNQPDVYVAYATLGDGEIKFRENNSWTLNHGDNGGDGTLEKDGENMTITAGTYKIVFNLANLTYTIENFTWGLVGDATTNGWDGPDMPMTYDSSSDTWKIIATLKEGKMKFRLNNDWGTNYGDDSNDGTIENGGSDISINAGTYLITMDLNNMSWNAEPIDLWGVIGNATPGGWDTDTDMTYDFKNQVWVVDITLSDGLIKFRANDAWSLNYGDDTNDGILDAGGADISVSSGNYRITLNLVNLRYTLSEN